MSTEATERRTLALALVNQERDRQVARYGRNDTLTYGFGSNVSAYHWLSPYSDDEPEVVCEKFRKDYAAHVASHGAPSWMHLIREEVAELFETQDTKSAIEEAVQVAALCVSLVELMMDPQGGGDMPEYTNVQVSEENRRILYEAYDAGDGDTICLREDRDGFFGGYWQGEKIMEGIEIDGVLYAIVPASDRTVAVIQGEGLMGNDLGVAFGNAAEAKAYIQGLMAKC
jgi:hypothetical protein